VIGLDTNVLVRYLTQDDPAQSRRANTLVAEAVSAGERLYVSAVVLCELVWVLRRAYGFDRGEVAQALSQVLATAQFEFGSKDSLITALAAYAAGDGDFADHVIGHQGVEAGCEHTVTFDRALKGVSAFRVL
jgi:predicted nucleic-acid-binding protein